MPVVNALVVATASRYIIAIHGLKKDHTRLHDATVEADTRARVTRTPAVVAKISAATMSTCISAAAYSSINTAAALIVTKGLVDITL